ncbi:MAG: maleylpyruvate isomerase family mycothiol-dependent enzyme [Ilumatobacteraceae bacterium]
MTLDFGHYLTALQTEGELFAAAIAAATPDTPIPTCADWTMSDLVRHTGEVHRWATTIIRGGLAKPSLIPADFLGPLPDDDQLVAWFSEGHAQLVDALASAPEELEAFVFHADPPPPRLFWARRQTHETTIHRVDAESSGGGSTPIEAAVAADGIDEMLTGFAPRKFTPLHADPATSMLVTTDDTPGGWRLTISDGPPVAERIESLATANATVCSVTGDADDIYRALWNRGDTTRLGITGDAGVLELFRDNVRIRWG